MRRFDLICFDVDGTLVEHPEGLVIWEVLNRRFIGSDEVNRERFRLYHEGKLSYEDWVRLDVSGWMEKKATRKELLEAASEFYPVEGALETVRTLKERGYKLGVVSGTLDILVDEIFPEHPFEAVYTNRVFFDESARLCGWQATPFDLHGKPIAMRQLAERFGTTLEHSAFVGDGENDVPLIGVVGYFVAFNPRSDELEKGADLVIRGNSLKKLLEVFP